MSKTTLSNPPSYSSVYGSPIVQTTLGPLNISSNSGSVWTQNAYSPSGHAVAGPSALMLWSSFRFEAKEWKAGNVARMFTTPRGDLGQGHPAALTTYDTNMLTGGRLPLSVDILGMSWELSRARPSGPLEELAQTVEDEPSRLEESLMGLVQVASIALESPQTVFAQALLSYDLPKGSFPWRGVEDWRGGLRFPPSKPFHIPSGCGFAIRVEILDTWRPIYPVILRVILDVAS